MPTHSKTPKPARIASDDDWQAMDDLRTLARAREIKADPKRLARAREYAQAQLVAAADAAATADK